MTTSNIHMSYRPARLGVLVREGNVEDIVAAANYNTIHWGGKFNPLIPVGPDSTLTDKLIELFSVDILVSLAESEEISKTLEKHKFLRALHQPTDSLLYTKGDTTYSLMLDINNLISYYWDKEFKFVQDPANSNAGLVKWDIDDASSGLFSIVFGSFAKPFERFENSYLKGLKAKEISIKKDSNVQSSIQEIITPINFTREQLLEYGHSSLDLGGVYIGKENDFKDLINFWNIRASGRSVLFYPYENGERWFDYIYSALKHLDGLPPRQSKSFEMIDFYYAKNESEDYEYVNTTMDKFDLTKDKSKYACDDIIWNGLNIIPSTYKTDSKDVLANLDISSSRISLSVSFPEKKFVDYESKELRQQHLVVNINPSTEYEYYGHTLKPPYDRELNEYYSRMISLSPFDLRVGKDGVSMIIDARDESSKLFPISKEEIIVKFFEHSNVKTKLSQAGLITKRITEQLGGLDKSDVFKVKGVRELLGKLDSTDMVVRSEAERIIYGDGYFRKYEDMYLTPRTESKLTKSDVFNFMLEKDIFRAGLELKCNNCNLKSWLSLNDIVQSWQCEYCGSDNKTSPQLKHRGDWKFRKSGLFSKDNNQEGAIPVLLTLQLLAGRFGGVIDDMMYSFSMNLSSESVDAEADFIVMNREISQPKERIEIGIAECKSAGGEIDKSDIDKYLAIRRAFQARSIECYFIYSKTVDDFTENEIELFKELLKDKIPFILLTNVELESRYNIYDGHKEQKIKNMYAHSLAQLAYNSVEIYLS
jgi:hypothetical protein